MNAVINDKISNCLRNDTGNYYGLYVFWKEHRSNTTDKTFKNSRKECNGNK